MKKWQNGSRPVDSTGLGKNEYRLNAY